MLPGLPGQWSQGEGSNPRPISGKYAKPESLYQLSYPAIMPGFGPA